MPNPQPSPDWLTIGRIVGPHGLNGEVRVYPDSDFPERFEQPGERWLLKPKASKPEPIQLLKGRLQEGKGLYILKLAGINHRAQAELLRDTQLVVAADDRLPLLISIRPVKPTLHLLCWLVEVDFSATVQKPS